MSSHGASFEIDPAGAVDEAVEDGVGQGRVASRIAPVGHRQQAAGLARKIPGASASDATVSAHCPKPADADGGATPTGTWDLDDQFLFGARDVVTDTGQALLNSVQFVTAARPGGLIPKPFCLTGMTPRIFTALNQVSMPSGRALNGIQLPVEELPDSWRIRAVITGSGGEETATTTTATVAVFTKCSY